MYNKFLDDVNAYIIAQKKANLAPLHPDEYMKAVRDQWINDNKFDELIFFILYNWNNGNCEEFSRPLSKQLIVLKKASQFKQLWKGIISNRLNTLWRDFNQFKQEFPEVDIQFILNVNVDGFNPYDSKESLERRIAWKRLYIIDGINEFIAGLKEFNDIDEIDSQKVLLQQIAELKKPGVK